MGAVAARRKRKGKGGLLAMSRNTAGGGGGASSSSWRGLVELLAEGSVGPPRRLGVRQGDQVRQTERGPRLRARSPDHDFS